MQLQLQYAQGLLPALPRSKAPNMASVTLLKCSIGNGSVSGKGIAPSSTCNHSTGSCSPVSVCVCRFHSSAVRWCLTVPAGLSQASMALMRKAAMAAGLVPSADSPALIITSEPEAAALTAKQHKDLLGLQSGALCRLVIFQSLQHESSACWRTRAHPPPLWHWWYPQQRDPLCWQLKDSLTAARMCSKAPVALGNCCLLPTHNADARLTVHSHYGMPVSLRPLLCTPHVVRAQVAG